MSEAKAFIAGWHSRGYLPHFDGGDLPQFITFRLHDSLPKSLLDQWRIEMKRKAPRDVNAALRRRIEDYLDQGHGAAYLKDRKVAAMVQIAMLFHDGVKYNLSAWVVMPNHIHLLATPCPKHTLSEIMHSLKSYTSSEANKMLGRKGLFWQAEYFDRYIRNADHFNKVIAYIENNPVKAGLCRSAEEWPFSRAWFRAQKNEGRDKAGSAGIPARMT